MSLLNVKLIKCLSDNYSYIIFNPITKKAIIVDPAEAQPLMDAVFKLNLDLEYILITHHHNDHVGGNIELKNKFNCKIVGFADDSNRIPGIDIRLQDKEIFNFEKENIQLNFAPGHTSGHIFYYFKKNKYAFVGDVIFTLGCGRIFEGTTNEMYKSIMKIKSLPDDVEIFCGHEYTANNLKFCLEYDKSNDRLMKRAKQIKALLNKNLPTVPTTVLNEKQTNIFFRCNDKTISHKLDLVGQSPEKVFEKLRQLKDNF